MVIVTEFGTEILNVPTTSRNLKRLINLITQLLMCGKKQFRHLSRSLEKEIFLYFSFFFYVRGHLSFFKKFDFILGHRIYSHKRKRPFLIDLWITHSDRKIQHLIYFYNLRFRLNHGSPEPHVSSNLRIAMTSIEDVYFSLSYPSLPDTQL